MGSEVSATSDLAKRLVKTSAHAVGLEVTRHRPHTDGVTGVMAFTDIRELVAGVARPIVFDVGANVGQSINQFTALLPGCRLHAFEPSPSAFRQLQANTKLIKRISNLTLVNAGVGARAGTQIFVENDHSDMSSFLRPAQAAWGTVIRETPVEVITLDEYCAKREIGRIDLLKIDTQGYELEVLKGAARLMGANAVHLIYLEVTFVDMYEGLPSLDQLYRFLCDRGFELVAFYNFVIHQNGTARWCDGLFANRAAVVADAPIVPPS